MSFTKLSPSLMAETQSRSQSAPARPRFNSQLTSDRLRESSSLCTPPFKMGENLRKDRRSAFKELGLDDDYPDIRIVSPESPAAANSESQAASYSTICDERAFGEITGLRTDFKSDEKQDGQEEDGEKKEESNGNESPTMDRGRSRQNSLSSWYSKLANSRGRPRIKSTSSAPTTGVSGLQRFTLIAMLIAVVIPALSNWEFNGAEAERVLKRADSPTAVCIRWAHQAAFLNGTLFIYGGEAKTEGSQINNTWNNYFLTLDFTKDWDTSSPPLTGLPEPDGPPAVALGYLWHDYNNLYMYGGEFSTSPYVDPGPESIWKYSISDSTWTEISNPETSAGNYSEAAGEPVHRAAEGAGVSVPELGLSWYFGGHLDWATTPGWSTDTPRVYLKSLLEFTHPGYVNSGVYDLSNGTGAGSSGAFRNITTGGVQANDFPERADGVLVFVPGWGKMGVLIGLAGGTADEFTPDLGTLDVYDIANSEWFHQTTSGDIPSVRVNPCAVVASAPDASSFQVYMFGGQNLQPYADQTQYNDMYILSIPSFTWIKVNATDSTPSPRAGHTCSLIDGQMVVVGGYLGNNTDCDIGFYVFNASALEWTTSFIAGDHDADFDPDNSVLAASYGYSVPKAVQEVIGGDQEGGATATTPAVSATGGPFATGKPPVFTVTQSGSTATMTGSSSDGGDGSGSGSGSGNAEATANHSGVNGRLVAAGVIAGVAGALAVYLGWCAYLYRRQVRAYKRHLAISNRFSGASMSHASLVPPPSIAGAAGVSPPDSFGWVGSSDPSSERRFTSEGEGKRSEDTRLGTSASGESTEGLLDGQEPSFFNVVMGPRRALRVVNGVE